MKKILLITSLYPCKDIKVLNNTAVCHYFAKEWVKMGYDVEVVFCYNVYPWLYYPILRMFRKTLANVMGVSIQDQRIFEVSEYEMDGIHVTRIPVYKSKPRGSFGDDVITDTEQIISTHLDNRTYRPDIILGHFTHPSLELVTRLKKRYNAKTAVSLHGPESGFSERDAKLFNELDYVGFRSYPIKSNFNPLYGSKPFFMCFSGVPENYIIDQPRTFEKGISSYIYVGAFMKRKYPSCIVPAVSKNYIDGTFRITFVGDGSGRGDIEKVVKRYDATKQVTFTGRLKRDEVTAQLDEADVFIMISKIETFGLVYLEAMARGCIVVASKNEGMEGIVKDGVNGFLCEAGNTEELTQVIAKIKSRSPAELQSISSEALKTAKAMTDCKVAKDYIQAIDKIN